MRNWLIYRGQHCLGGYRGAYSEAKEYAYTQWGIGCSVVAER